MKNLKELIERRIVAEKKKKTKAIEAADKAAIGGKIRAFNEVLNYIGKGRAKRENKQ